MQLAPRVAGGLLLAATLGCVTKGTYDEVAGERDRLVVVRRDLEQRVEQLQAANQSLTSERVALIDENEDLRIAAERDGREVARLTRLKSELTEDLESSKAMLAERTAEIQKLRSSYDGLISDLEQEIAAGQIQIEQLRSGLKLNLSDEILFPSGSAKLNPSGVELLRKVSQRLIELPNSIVVEGHTDNVPVARVYPSNWELAAARASAVVRLLIELGVDPQRFKVVSRGEYAPIASNDTAEGRAKNRRIEILLEATVANSDARSGDSEPPASGGAGATTPQGAREPDTPPRS